MKRLFWVSVVLGLLLRTVYPSDIEFKEDEKIMFDAMVRVGHAEPWPMLGMGSTVWVRNPGMSIWVFVVLGKVFCVNTPEGAARMVAVLSIAALLLAYWIGKKYFDAYHQKAWTWALCLVAVNPISIMYSRKIWAQSILPVFVALLFWAWCERKNTKGAFFWGLLGAAIGQIHMSGFFFAFAVLAGTWIWDRASFQKHWRAWIAGSAVASIAMIPWFFHLLDRPTGGHAISGGLNEALQLRYWVFWFTETFGLHIGNALGVHLGNSIFIQLQEFLKYPLIGSTPTYLVGVAHAVLVFSLVFVVVSAAWMRRKSVFEKSVVEPFERSLFWIYGVVLSATGIVVRRFYLIINFPWIQFFLIRRLPEQRRWVLSLIWGATLLVSISFLQFIRIQGGAPQGDFGSSLRTQTQNVTTQSK